MQLRITRWLLINIFVALAGFRESSKGQARNSGEPKKFLRCGPFKARAAALVCLEKLAIEQRAASLGPESPQSNPRIGTAKASRQSQATGDMYNPKFMVVEVSFLSGLSHCKPAACHARAKFRNGGVPTGGHPLKRNSYQYWTAIH